jgi:hypothetical protein
LSGSEGAAYRVCHESQSIRNPGNQWGNWQKPGCMKGFGISEVKSPAQHLQSSLFPQVSDGSGRAGWGRCRGPKPARQAQSVAHVEGQQSHVSRARKQFERLHDVEGSVEGPGGSPTVEENRARNQDQQAVSRDERHALFLVVDEPPAARFADVHAAARGRSQARDQDPQARRDDQRFQVRNSSVQAEKLYEHGGRKERGDA